MNLFKTNSIKGFNESKYAKNVYFGEQKQSKFKVQKQSEEDNIFKSIRNCSKLKKRIKQ